MQDETGTYRPGLADSGPAGHPGLPAEDPGFPDAAAGPPPSPRALFRSRDPKRGSSGSMPPSACWTTSASCP